MFNKERMKAWFDIELKSSYLEKENGLTIMTKCFDLRFSNANSFDAKLSNVLWIYLVDYVFMVFVCKLFYKRTPSWDKNSLMHRAKLKMRL